MSHQFRILSVSRDVGLLSTRAAVLASAGYWVTSATSVAEAQETIATQPFDAVVLCHTLSAKERKLLAAMGQDRNLPCVCIYTHEFKPHVPFAASNDPNDLLLAVKAAAAGRAYLSGDLR